MQLIGILAYFPPQLTLPWCFTFFAGTALFVWGCYNYAKSIGHHGAWGLLGISSLLGAILLASFPDLTEIDPMTEQYSREIRERNALLGTISGLIIQFSIQLADFPSPFTFYWYPLMLTGIGAFIWGCCNFTEYKGYHFSWGVLGGAGLMGALMLSMLPEIKEDRSNSDVLSALDGSNSHASLIPSGNAPRRE